MGPQMVHVPLVQLQHISDAVDPPLRLQQEPVLRQETCIDDPSAVIFGLEVGIWKTDEYLLQTALREVLTQVTHGVSPNHADMIVLAGILDAVPSDLLRDEVDQFVPDLHSQDELIGEERGETEQQSSVAAPHIDDGDVFAVEGIVPGLFVEGGVLYGVAVSLVIVLLSGMVVEGVVGLPVDEGVMGGEGEGRGIEWIDVCAHTVIFLLGDQSFFLEQLSVAFVEVGLLALFAFALHKRNIKASTLPSSYKRI